MITNDLSQVTRGDMVWHVIHGWQEVESINFNEGNYPISISDMSYTVEGKQRIRNNHPTIFETPGHAIDYYNSYVMEFGYFPKREEEKDES